MEKDALIDLVFNGIKKLVFPEEWLEIDLSLSKQDVFALLLLDREGEIIMSRIAEYVHVSMSTATGIVDRLVKNGYLERNRSEVDRRVVKIRLTEKAKRVVECVKNVGSDYLSIVMNALTDEEKRFLFSIVEKIIAAVNARNGASDDGATGEAGRIVKIDIE